MSEFSTGRRCAGIQTVRPERAGFVLSRLRGKTLARDILAVALLASLGGCSSWFFDEPEVPTKPGVTLQSQTPQGGASVSASGVPDINTVPTVAPQPSSLGEVQGGLAADSSNAQYSDQTLTPVVESAARPAAPVEPAAAVPAPAEASGTQQPQVVAQALPGTAPSVTAPSGPVAYVGAPQPGAKPFEPDMAGMAAVGPSVNVNYGMLGAGGTYGFASYGQQRVNPAQAYYRSPYGATAGFYPTGYGTAPTPAIGAAPMMPTPMIGQGQLPQGQLPIGFQPFVPGPSAAVVPPPMPVAGQPVGIVYFGSGSASLSSDDRRVVKKIAEMQRYYGGVVRVIGHSSQRTGNMNVQAQQQANYEVSLRRANAVARALVQAGVPASNVQVAGAGDRQPAYAETMPAGEAANRRVEVFLSAY